MLPAVVLAAGDSSRMGQPKALLRTPDGRPFVVAIVQTLAAAGVHDIVVVTGKIHDRIAEAVANERLPVSPRFVRNADPSQGQLSSLWIGMDAAITESTPALMVTLVDVPLIKVETIETVTGVWRRSRAPIVRPAMDGRHGHPVIFDRAVFAELRAAPLSAGAKTVVRAHAADLIDVPVSDEGCLADVDTPADYELLRRSTIPSGRTPE